MKDIRLISRLCGADGWDTDMAVPVKLGNGSVAVFGGDCTDRFRALNCVGVLRGDEVRWMVDGNGAPVEIFDDKRGDSLTPSGGISIDGQLYVFMMDIRWSDKKSCAVLLKQTFGTNFEEIWRDYQASMIFPVGGYGGLYLFYTKKYADSPIYCQAVRDCGIEDVGACLGGDEQMIVQGKFTEPTVMYHQKMKKWVLGSFYEYAPRKKDFYVAFSDRIEGPYKDKVKVVDGMHRYPWYEEKTDRYGCPTGQWWEEPYAAFFLEDESQGDDLVFTMGLWEPYTVVKCEVNWSELT